MDGTDQPKTVRPFKALRLKKESDPKEFVTNAPLLG
jgi:hypothetical protein